MTFLHLVTISDIYSTLKLDEIDEKGDDLDDQNDSLDSRIEQIAEILSMDGRSFDDIANMIGQSGVRFVVIAFCVCVHMHVRAFVCIHAELTVKLMLVVGLENNV